MKASSKKESQMGESTRQPSVATLMSVYQRDRPEWVGESLDSLLGQTYPKLDVHVVRDGPVSAELEALLERYERQRRITVHRREENRGLGAALNVAIEWLRDSYDYLLRMDADDSAFPDRVERQVAFMERNPDVDVVGGAIVDMDESGRHLKKVVYPTDHAAIRRFFEKRNPVGHVTAMFRPRYFDRAGLYPESRLEDTLLWMKGFEAGCRFANLAQPLVAVRTTDDFLKRRSGFNRNLNLLKGRFLVHWRLRARLRAYIYALAGFVLQMLPVPIKRLIYATFR